MNEKINGIVINGEFFENVKGTFCCNGCEFSNPRDRRCTCDVMLCYAFGDKTNIFKFSQTLTDKLNK